MTILGERLIARIRAEGPLSVGDYMMACLHDAANGYYSTRPAVGECGDFITAPAVSQMFGELIGLWLVEAWRRLGAPARFTLAEFGPGEGTMMADMLRATRIDPEFLAAADIWLIEVSGPLRAAQARALAGHAVTWAADIEQLPEKQPLLAVGNEFLDCLPIDQCVRADEGWRGRRIGVVDGELTFVAERPATDWDANAPLGAIREESAALGAFGGAVGARVARAGGAALFVDYGRDVPGGGDTLQAVRGHRKESPLAHPGEADVTAHVDFPAFLSAAEGAGAQAAPVETQRAFLLRLGLHERARALGRAHPRGGERLRRQVDRLTAPAAMGDLFKVACVHGPGFVPP